MDKKQNCLHKFYKCPICGNIMEAIHDAGVKPMCCGSEMEEMIPKDKEEGMEKHIPTFTCSKGTIQVRIGSEAHPMTEEHHICWAELVTSEGCQRKMLNPKEEPAACFCVNGSEDIIAIYAYCNLHGLWVCHVNSKDCQPLTQT